MMNKRDTLLAPEAPTLSQRSATQPRPPLRAVGVGLLVVTLAFAQPLWRLVEFALSSDLYSYILLIPALSGYLVWQKWSSLPRDSAPTRRLATTLLFGGGAVAGIYLVAGRAGAAFTEEDALAFTTTAYVLIAVGVTAWFLGRLMLSGLAFPLGLLAFIIPLPSGAMVAVETFMQHGSAWVAKGLFNFSGTAVFYHDLAFQLPGGINLLVAPECSGIRSTIALTIVGLVTGYFFLRTPVRRAILVFAILPLALLRNGFRIFTIGELCVQFGSHMIDSPLHHRGGPVFFALSLVPFFLLAYLLQRNEQRRGLPSRAGTRQ